jgi:ribosomal-protein-alanine N-acetyltransferase
LNSTTLNKNEGRLLLKTQFRIIPFDEHHLDEVVNINRTCLPENYSKYFFMNLHRRFPKTFLVAVIEGQVVGYILCRIEMGLSELGKLSLTRKAHIVSLAVLPKFRGTGIASSLVRTALMAMIEYNANESYLEVRVSNYPAINLYRKFGFKPRRTIPHYYRDGENGLVMTKTF